MSETESLSLQSSQRLKAIKFLFRLGEVAFAGEEERLRDYFLLTFQDLKTRKSKEQRPPLQPKWAATRRYET